MKYYASILIAFLILADIAFGAVGDVGVSDGSITAESGQSYNAEMTGSALSQSSGYQAPSYRSSGSQSSGYSSQTKEYSRSELAYPAYPQSSQQSSSYQQSQKSDQNYALNYGSNNYGSNYASSAPQVAGPYQERLSADDLKFTQPQAESFKPDGSLNFAPASPPSGISTDAYNPGQEQGYWYYPGSVTSRNRFYVQTSSGLKTTAGCSNGGYLPLWSDINSAGNFYVYEWYPGQLTPSVRWWGWTWTGFKKGWFTGDVPGWHILSYNCRDWSNYIYIYVWPSGGSAYVSGNNAVSPAGYSTINQAALPSGAPTPPDPNAENLMLPDFNLLQPGLGSYAESPTQATQTMLGSPVQSGGVPQVNYPQAIYPLQGTYPSQGISLPQSSYSGCTACSDKTGTSGAGSYGSYTAPPGYAGAQTYQAVFPKPTAYRCNEYYVQAYPGKLATVAGTKCGEWLPLWSKIGRAGAYWSFEWAQCSGSNYCYPDVKSFGYKGTGWYQTWFRGNRPGWHILSYYDNDWSNYVYVYVWPA